MSEARSRLADAIESMDGDETARESRLKEREALRSALDEARSHATAVATSAIRARCGTSPWSPRARRFATHWRVAANR